MNTPFFIAKRYFWSKKKSSFISIISIISMIEVAIVTMALVIVLSVYNGMSEMIKNLYNTFDPELKVVPTKGKSFELDKTTLEDIQALPGVSVVTEVIEDNAFVRYRDAQVVITMKGVSDNYVDQHRLDSMVVEGDFKLRDGRKMFAVIGRGVQYVLSLSLKNDFYPLQFFYPKRGKVNSIDPTKLTNRKIIAPSGVFAIERKFDYNYVFVPIDFAADLLEYGNRRTALEIQIVPTRAIPEVKAALQKMLGDDFEIQTQDEQHAEMIRVLKLEKFFVFLTFAFIIGVASVTIFFTLSMLAIEKKKDIAVLYTLGAERNTIQKIFLYEGILISFTGAIIGLTLGYGILYLQDTFGFVKMGMQTAIFDDYPVKIEWIDFLIVSLTLIIVTSLASFRPASMATKYDDNALLQ
ncbi:ABC transporter permease [Persicobacter diffluens]|uniref:Membrane protein n=1 Tax=Persicobacter diffluens TaxID=981 RepID=A0AAN4VTJ1_9BACT|nr:membrane protein [Persicobacter diffluens]